MTTGFGRTFERLSSLIPEGERAWVAITDEAGKEEGR